jgi:hypothetical protein
MVEPTMSQVACNLCHLVAQHIDEEIAVSDIFALGFVAGSKATYASVMPRLCSMHLKYIAVVAERHNIRLIEVASDEEAKALRAELEMTAFRVAPGRPKA